MKIEKPVGLNDSTIIGYVYKTNKKPEELIVERGKPIQMRKYTIVPITIIGLESECKIIQKKFAKYNHEINKYNFLGQYCSSVLPEIYYIDLEKRIVLMDDLNEKYFPGFHFNDDNEYGIIFRKNYKAIINALAKFHGTFWENHKTFKQVGLDRRLESKENLIDHINGMEKDFKKYRNAEKADRIPKKWENFENKIEIEKLEYFQTAINMLKQEYVKLIDTRFKRGKNITIIHGDFHPGNTYMSMSKSRDIKFIDFEAVRIGLCTEDLAMFLALHVEPKLKTAKPLLEHYYKCLCEYAKDYSYDNFIDDYKISVMENMFFTIRLINRGIFDFYMRDRAIMAFETLILRNG